MCTIFLETYSSKTVVVANNTEKCFVAVRFQMTVLPKRLHRIKIRSSENSLLSVGGTLA